MTVKEAAERVRRGELVIFPTETVYGLGADARNAAAVQQIFEAKGRPADNPLIIHISSTDQLSDFIEEIPAGAETLIHSCWPGPLALIFKKRNTVLDLVTAGLPTVAIRMPNHKLALELIRLAAPLAAPSANLSGKPSPTRPGHAIEDFGGTIPILEGDPPHIGIESTVLDVTSEPFRILRPGHFSAAQLEDISGVSVVLASSSELTSNRSPGTRYTHYRPNAAVHWFRDEDQSVADTLLVTHSVHPDGWREHVRINGGFEELAYRLYDLFREADRSGLKRILIEPLPEDSAHPIVAALRNRIERAIE